MSDIEFRQLAREMNGQRGAGSSLLLLSIVTLIALLVVWASVTELDNVTRGSGKTVSEAKNQMVQSSEPGTIRKRYVSEGDVVSKGEILFDIDPIDAKTQLEQIRQRLKALDIKTIRLEAEVNGRSPDFSSDLLEEEPTLVTTELALFRARLDDLVTKSAILEQRRLQKLNEVEELKIQVQTAQRGLELIQREINTIQPLVDAGLAPETRLLSLQREEEQALGQISSAESAQIRLSSALDEIDEQLKAEKQAYKTSALTDLSASQGEIAELVARAPALENRLDRTSVRSPVDGVVNRINYTTDDAYVNTGDILLEIVPTGSELIVETQIDPKDIGEIVLGQDVKISLTAYDPTRYGRIDGKVMGISADAITDQSSGMQFYMVDVSIESVLYEDDGSEVTILPGMIASIDVLAGKRTVLEYIWQPVAKTKEKALRD